MQSGIRYGPDEKSGMLKSGDAIRERLRAAGLRVTVARVRVLTELTAFGGLLSHHLLEQRLEHPRMDRVTLYRVLNSLVARGLVHRVSGSDRIWCFGMAQGKNAGTVEAAHGEHAHFQCRDCGKLVCLDSVASPGDAVRVPRGYRAESVELTVRGRCPGCA